MIDVDGLEYRTDGDFRIRISNPDSLCLFKRLHLEYIPAPA